MQKLDVPKKTWQDPYNRVIPDEFSGVRELTMYLASGQNVSVEPEDYYRNLDYPLFFAVPNGELLDEE